jgi:L-asparaginase/Glu-tRNA(Gln) amidotransferase subunit D
MMQENRETISNTARMTEQRLKGGNVITSEGVERYFTISSGAQAIVLFAYGSGSNIRDTAREISLLQMCTK